MKKMAYTNTTVVNDTLLSQTHAVEYKMCHLMSHISFLFFTCLWLLGKRESDFIFVIKFCFYSDFQTPINCQSLSMALIRLHVIPGCGHCLSDSLFDPWVLWLLRAWTLTFVCLFSAAASCPIILSCILLQWAITSLSTARGLGPTARPCGCTGEQLSMFCRSSASLSRCRARNGSLRSYWP